MRSTLGLRKTVVGIASVAALTLGGGVAAATSAAADSPPLTKNGDSYAGTYNTWTACNNEGSEWLGFGWSSYFCSPWEGQWVLYVDSIDDD